VTLGFYSDPDCPRDRVEHELAMRYGHRDTDEQAYMFEQAERHHLLDFDPFLRYGAPSPPPARFGSTTAPAVLMTPPAAGATVLSSSTERPT